MKRFDYDLVVIGGGAAGMVSSRFAAGLGKGVALVEHRNLGGECTRYGCVPSKALIRTANIRYWAEEARCLYPGLGVSVEAPVDSSWVMERVRRIIDDVYDTERPEVLEKAGVKVLFGKARFLDNHHLEVNGKTISAGKYVVSTGSSAFIPPIEGIDTVPYLTNESIFDLASLPESLIILGGGPIGVELAQALNRLAVKVVVVEMGDRILAREDREFGDIVARRIGFEGVDIRTSTKAVKLDRKGESVLLTVEDALRGRTTLEAHAVLVAVGRKANVDGLALENVGVSHSPKGIETDMMLRTTAPDIYACGDVVGPYQFSHMAEYQARVATRNALLPGRKKADYRHYLWSMFTDPELAHAGLTEEEAQKGSDGPIRVYRWAYGDTDRGKTDSEPLGMSKIICDKRYRIVGAHIVGKHAADLMHEIQIIKTLAVPFHKLDSVIHIYPTISDVVRQPAKLCRIDRLRNHFFVKTLQWLTRRMGREG